MKTTRNVTYKVFFGHKEREFNSLTEADNFIDEMWGDEYFYSTKSYGLCRVENGEVTHAYNNGFDEW